VCGCIAGLTLVIAATQAPVAVRARPPGGRDA